MPFVDERTRLAQELAAARAAERELCEVDLLHYMTCAWEILEPRTPMIRGYYQDAMCDHLQAAFTRQIKRLIINIPPRHAKSNTVTVSFPTWAWALQPWLRFMFFSYAQDLSTKHSMDRRALMESPWYRRNWGKRVQLVEDQKTELTNTARGHMIATSLHGGAMGKGGDILIVDDPHDVKRADSDPMREQDLVLFDRAVRSRLNDKKNGVIILVMQRLHETDLTGHLLATEPGEWTHLCLPAEAKARTVIQMPYSGKQVVREAGDVLVPEYQSKEQLEKEKRGMGSYAFAGQYDQAPSPPGGGIIKPAEFKRYTKLPDRFDRKIISVDCAFKDTEESSYVCFQSWGKAAANYYLIDLYHAKLDFPTMLKEFQDWIAKGCNAGIIEKVVEDKANGPAMIAMLKDKISGLVAYSPDRDKVSRARAVSPLMEAGNVWVPAEGAVPWLADFLQECRAFPKGALKDRVDTMTQALLKLSMDSSGSYEAELVQTPGSTIAGARTPAGTRRW